MLYTTDPHKSKLYTTKPYKSKLYDELTVPGNKMWNGRSYSSKLYEGGKTLQEKWEDGTKPLPPFNVEGFSGLYPNGSLRIDNCDLQIDLNSATSPGYTYGLYLNWSINGGYFNIFAGFTGTVWSNLYAGKFRHYLNSTNFGNLLVNNSNKGQVRFGAYVGHSTGLDDYKHVVVRVNPGLTTVDTFVDGIKFSNNLSGVINSNNIFPMDLAIALIAQTNYCYRSNFFVYKRALSDTEISDLAEKNYIHLTPQQKVDLVSWWNLNDSPDGTHYPDSVGNNHAIVV